MSLCVMACFVSIFPNSDSEWDSTFGLPMTYPVRMKPRATQLDQSQNLSRQENDSVAESPSTRFDIKSSHTIKR